MQSLPNVRPLALVLGAGSVMGRALAADLGGRGCDLLLADGDGELLLNLREELTRLGVTVQLFQGDTARPAHRRDLQDFLNMAGVKPDIVVFLCGSQFRERRLGSAPAAARRLQEGGLAVLDELLRAGLLSAMLREGNGFVLVLLPARLLSPRPGEALGSALATAQRCYVQALGRELAGSGVSLTLGACADAAAAWLETPHNARQDPPGAPAAARRAVSALFSRRRETALPASSAWRMSLLRLLPPSLGER